MGEWIPEPLPEPAEWAGGRPGATADPANRVTLDESVSEVRRVSPAWWPS